MLVSIFKTQTKYKKEIKMAETGAMTQAIKQPLKLKKQQINPWQQSQRPEQVPDQESQQVTWDPN